MNFTIPTEPVEGEFEDVGVTWRYRVRPTLPAAAFELCHELGISMNGGGIVEDARLALRAARSGAPVLLDVKTPDGTGVTINGQPWREANLLQFIEAYASLGIAIGQRSLEAGWNVAGKIGDESGN